MLLNRIHLLFTSDQVCYVIFLINFNPEEGKRFFGYNIYIRKDPRKLAEIPFEGDLVLKKNMVINMTEEFRCEGYGIIAVANVINLYEAIGVDVMQKSITIVSRKQVQFRRKTAKYGRTTELPQADEDGQKPLGPGREIFQG
mgnify:CR=1 FL=1